uniref:RB_A domain-containing protein n=1 Tax=Ascaris lumbricoides TaxID=6252 RepID=A0A0M3HHV7_ASCLU
MLLGEVKHFWEKVVSFCREISKLIEYTLDSSCNALIAILLEQVENATVRSKFRLKDRVRHDIYQVALACVAYALSVRHLTDAYSAFSSEFLMPQMDAISRYPLVANSEIELAQAREQFKELNVACSKVFLPIV